MAKIQKTIDFNQYKFYAEANLNKYAGKWVVMINNKIVAYGKTLKKVMAEAKKKYPTTIPFVAKIPTGERH